MPPLHRPPSPQSVHSWWSDSNPPGATIPLHTLAKPLSKYLHRRQVSGIIAKSRSSPLSKEVLDILKRYLEAEEIASSTKIMILEDLRRRAQREDQARMMIQENVHHTLIYLLHSPDTGTPEAYRLNTSIVESACAILAIFTLAHPSPPFSSDSLHFTSRFLYTVFSQRTCGLSTGLALLLTASYLSLATLHAEVQAYIVAEMAHGLFHADISFAEYEALTHGVWRVGGCTCPQCASRVPRILRFALRPDVGDLILQRGARRALVGLFGPGWCTPEFATLPVELQVAALKGLAKRTTPRNALAILWAAEAARTQLAAASTADSWAEIVRPLVDAGRAQVDAVLGGQTAAVFAEADWGALVRADAEADWVAIMREDSERFEDGERVECVMRSVVRGMNEMNVGRVYQALMDLLPDTDPFQPEQLYTAQPLSQASHVRVQAARMDVLTWLKRGGRVRAERVARKGGFDGVNSRALREIGNFLEISMGKFGAVIPPMDVEDAPRQVSTSPASAPLDARGEDADAHGLGARVHQDSRRTVASSKTATPPGERSLRKRWERLHQEVTDADAPRPRVQASEAGKGAEWRLRARLPLSRADGMLRSKHGNASAPPTATSKKDYVLPPLVFAEVADAASADAGEEGEGSKWSPHVPLPRSRLSGAVSSTLKGKVRARHGNESTSPPTVSKTESFLPPVLLMPTASTSTLTPSTLPAPRSHSAMSLRPPTDEHAPRPDSAPPTSTAPNLLRLPTLRPSGSSRTSGGRSGVANAAGSTSARDTAASAARKVVPAANREKRPEVKVITLKHRGRVAHTTEEVDKPEEEGKTSLGQMESVASRARPSTPRLGRAAGSLSSILTNAAPKPKADPQPDALLAPPSTPPSQRLAPVQPVLNAAKALLPPPLPARGATLEIGIPCIILWKRERLKAVARYIGEVEGEAGPWVGLEVPASAVDGDGQWHDGSWGGIRYFELDGVWSDREHARGTRGGRSPRREEKRVRGVSPDVEGSRDSRGLFVRPSVVLYVVDAVADS